MNVGATRGLTTSAIAALIVLRMGASSLEAARPARVDGMREGDQTGATATAWNTFTADVIVQRMDLAVDGSVIRRPLPATSFRVTRWRTLAGWKTTMILTQVDRPAVRTSAGLQALDNPFFPARVEFDGAGLPPRLYNRRGELMRTPSELDLRVLNIAPATSAARFSSKPAASQPFTAPTSTSGWIDGVIAMPDKVTARRQTLEQQFGPPRARVRGLDRYLATRGDVNYELLVDPNAVVIVEITGTRGFQVVVRLTFAYDTRSDGARIRRLMRREQVIPNTVGERAVTEVQLANAAFSVGGTR